MIAMSFSPLGVSLFFQRRLLVVTEIVGCMRVCVFDALVLRLDPPKIVRSGQLTRLMLVVIVNGHDGSLRAYAPGPLFSQLHV
jgi:hypothetical protein